MTKLTLLLAFALLQPATAPAPSDADLKVDREARHRTDHPRRRRRQGLRRPLIGDGPTTPPRPT